MAKKIKWKSADQGIDELTRTIIVEEEVTEVRTEEFSLEKKYQQRTELERQKVSIQKHIDDLTVEIDVVKSALGVE